MSDNISDIASRVVESLPENDSHELEDRLQELQAKREAQREARNSQQPNPRLTRRERLIRQTTQPRASERRSYMGSSILQRTPVRSSSFDVNEDSRHFRDRFDTSRQNLFGSRLSGSNESLTTSPILGRRHVQSDLVSQGTRGVGLSGSDSGSGSSTPRTMRQNPADLVQGLTEAFTSSFNAAEHTELPRSSTVAPREPRNLISIYGRQNVMPSPSSTNNFTRRERNAESRLRRRTISVDQSVREALETERRGQSHQDASISSYRNNTENRDPLSSSTNSYSKYTSRTSFRKLELTQDETIPHLGLDDDLVIFIDPTGHCHWIRGNKQLCKSVKAKQRIPEIIIKNGEQNNLDDNEGLVLALKGEREDIYEFLNEHLKTSRSREGKKGDVEEKTMTPEIIDEKYKTESLYTSPRQRQNIETFLTDKTVVPLYDGIDLEALKPNVPSVVSTENVLSKWMQTNRAPLKYTLSFAHLNKNNPRTSVDIFSDEPVRTTREPNLEWQSSRPVIDNSDQHQDVNLVMERLHGLGMTLDTTNLDYEELRMIQMALEDNPSPPETPHEEMYEDVPQSVLENYYESERNATNNIVLESLDQNVISEPIVEMEEHFQDSAQTGEEQFDTESHEQATVTSGNDNATVDSQTENTVTTRNENTSAAPRSFTAGNENTSLTLQEENTSVASQNVTEADSAKHENEITTSEMQTKTVTSQRESENVTTLSAAAKDKRGAGTSSSLLTPTSIKSGAKKGSPPTSLPTERLPSQSAISPKLPLPSMVFSPVEKQAKKELDFSLRSSSSSERNSVSDRASDPRKESVNSRKSMSEAEEVFEEETFYYIDEEPISPSSKTNTDPMERVSELLSTTNGERYQQQLTVQVPLDADADRKSSPKCTTPIKSRNPSSNASGAASPALSDTVTTTFEEFIAVLPQEILAQINKENNS